MLACIGSLLDNAAMLHTAPRQILEGTVGAAGMVLAFFTPFLRASRDHWGLSPELAARSLPGDALAGPEAYCWTHGLEIDAPASAVWPWVVQLGQDKGGFYSYEFLENLAGCSLHNADEVHPEWQQLRAGDGLRLHPSVPPLPVVEVVPGRYFVAGGSIDPGTGAEGAPGADEVRLSWLLLVEPVDALRCRFISRFRLQAPSSERLALSPSLLEPVGFVMDRRMLLGVRERAQRAIHAPSLREVGPLDLTGKTCLVTGASRGIGRATAEWLVRAGARVGLLCRSAAAAEEVAAHLGSIAGSDAVFAVRVDLSSMASVVDAARELLRRGTPVDVLIHNAGEYRTDRAVTADGFERMLAVGYLGPWLLTALLRPRLIERARARILVTAGIYHRRGQLDLSDMHWQRTAWDPMAANSRMQLARASFALELSRQLAGSGVCVNAVHPGAVRTQSQDSLTGWQRLLMETIGRFVFVEPPRGALPNLRLAGEAALDGVSGRYYSGLHEAEASADARSPELARSLWQWTEETLGPWLSRA